MSTAQAKHEFTDDELNALLEKAVGAREQKEREERVGKAGGALGDAVGFYEYVGADVWSHAGRDFHTDLCRCQRLPAPKWWRTGDVIEINEADRIPSEKIFRKLSPEKASARVTLQDLARLRLRQAPAAAAEDSLRRVEGEILKTEEIRASIEKQLAALRAEKDSRAEKLDAAKQDLEDFLAARSPESRTALLAQADVDRESPPKDEGGPARAIFAPRAPGEGKRYTLNSAGQREEM